jgi:PAS domain S-box-containing protein
MDEPQSDVRSQMAALRSLLAEIEARCAEAPLSGHAPDCALFARALESLHAVELALLRIQGQAGGRADGGERASLPEEGWFKEMAGVLPVGVMKLSLTGQIVYANDRLLDMFGVTRAELESGLFMWEFLSPGGQNRLSGAVEWLRSGGTLAPTIYRVHRKDGTRFAVEVIGAPTQNAPGRMTGFWGIVRDVSLELRERDMQEIRTRLRLSLASVSHLGRAMDLLLEASLALEGIDSGCVYVVGSEPRNSSVVSARGLSEEFVRFVEKRGVDPSHGRRGHLSLPTRSVKVGYEDLARMPDSTPRDEGLRSMLMVPLKQDEVPVALLVVGSHTEDDISGETQEALEAMVDQVTAVIARIKAEEDRRRAVERFEALFDTAPLALYVLDTEGRVLMWNEAATRMFGWDASEVLGQLPPFIDDTNREEFRENLRCALSASVEYRREFERRHRDGRMLNIRIYAAVLHDDRGAPSGLLAVTEDVTELKRAFEAKLRMGRLESLGALAGGIAHDFNNVLMIIAGNLSLAQMETDPEVRGQLLAEAQDATQRAVGLTSRLVTFAKGGAPVKEEVDLEAIITQVAERVLGGSNVQFELDLKASSRVEADPVQLREAIRSLVLNAKEAMPDGGVVRFFTEDVSEPDENPLVHISISDTGRGIPPELLERIFDPYFSTKSDNVGMGLAGAHSIITQHGGRISVESKSGVGSRFDIFLPASRPVKPGSRQEEVAVAGADGSCRVLVVDDEDMVRTLLVRMLERLGFSAVTCSSGEEAVQIYQDAIEAGQPFAAVITDLVMPAGMDGVKTAASLRAIDPKVKVIASSGYSDDPAMARCEDFGFSGAVRKPYTLDSLREALGRCGLESAD